MNEAKFRTALVTTMAALTGEYTSADLSQRTGIPLVTLVRRRLGYTDWRLLELVAVGKVIGLSLSEIAERVEGYHPIPDRSQRAAVCSRALQEAGVTRRDLSEALGISYMTVYRKLNGKAPIRPHEMEKIAALTGRSLTEEAEAIAAADVGIEMAVTA